MEIQLDRLFGTEARAETCERVTFSVGGVRVDVMAGRTAGRPSLTIRAVEGALAALPSTTNTLEVIAYSDLETAENAKADRRAIEDARASAAAAPTGPEVPLERAYKIILANAKDGEVAGAVSYLQRKLGSEYRTAIGMVDEMTRRGWISPADGRGVRRLLRKDGGDDGRQDQRSA